jgi:phosphate transport system substrate-binding protein
MSRPALAAILLAALLPHARTHAESIKMQGSPIVAHVMAGAAPKLREQGIEIKVTVEGSSTVAAAMLAAGEVDFALLMRPLTGEDRARFPDRELKEFRIGTQAVALIVPKEVWESGVKALTKAQIKEIYEGRITNWKEVGGLDLPLRFYNSERGRGVWELFVTWLYGESRKAPLGKFPITVDGEDARNTVHFTKGACGLAQINWIDGKDIFGLAIIEDGGPPVPPTAAEVATGKYPLARPAYVVVGEKPVGQKKRIIDFLLSPAGQAIVGQSDLLNLQDVTPK